MNENKMEEKQLFKVKITDENGNVVHEGESDCIIAAISTEKEKEVHGIFMTNCDVKTMVKTFKTIDTIKKKATEENPVLGTLLQWLPMWGQAEVK